MSHEDIDWSQVIADEASRYHDVLLAAAPDAIVPSCPGWDLTALTDHLGGLFGWVRELVVAGATERLPKPERDPDADLGGWFLEGAQSLARCLADASPAPDLWTFVDTRTDDGLAFWRRRMAHETLVHRYDAELAAGVPSSPVAPWLAVDGIDELWQYYAEGVPDWMTFTAGIGVVRIEATDTDAAWALSLGRANGTTGSGREVDRHAMRFTSDPADTLVRAPVGELHRWLWGRGALPPTVVEGNPSHVVTLRAAIADAS